MFVRILIIVLVGLIGWSVLARASSGAGHPVHYVVKPADTLWSIAQARYAGDPREAILRIEQTNHLRGPLIAPGQTLLLP